MSVSTRATADAMAAAAEAMLEGFDLTHRQLATSSFDDSLRTKWAYFPREMAYETYPGAMMGHLSITEQKLVHRLLTTGMARPAYAQMNATMALEPVLDDIEGHRMDYWRDPNRFWIMVYGTPESGGTWSWRFEGHHVSINHTIVDGEVVSSTPFFLGANPAHVRIGRHFVTRPIAAEDDLGRELFLALDDEQQAIAKVHDESPEDMITHWLQEIPEYATAGEPRHPLDFVQVNLEPLSDEFKKAIAFHRDAPAGIAAKDLTDDQRDVFETLIDVYIGRLPADCLELEKARLDEAGRDGIYFSWAGSTEMDEGHYYRLHGPTFLVEFDCTQDNANHSHALWRDPVRDMGRDILREHLANQH